MSGNVLLLSAGRRVSLLRGFQEAAARRSDIRVYAADANPHLSAACNVADAAFELPRVNAPDYADALLALCRAQSIKFVAPTIDPELPVLAGLRERFLDAGVELIVCDGTLTAAFADKRTTATFFGARGLPAPKIMARDAIVFPAFMKPYDGSLSVGAMLLREPEDLTPAMLENPRNIFCEYIDHKTHDEFTCDLYFDRGGALKCVVPRKRLEVRGGEVSKGEACKNELVPMLFDAFAQLDGARGAVTLQVFRHRETGAVYFNEINARFGGGYPLTRLAGADFQDWLITEYIEGGDVDRFDDWTDGAIMLRYDGEVIVHRQ